MLHRIYTLAPRARLIEHAGRKLLVSDYPLQQFELNDTAWQVLSTLSPGVPLDDLVSPVTPPLVDFLEAKTVQGALCAEYRVTPAAELPPGFSSKPSVSDSSPGAGMTPQPLRLNSLVRRFSGS